jgi:hypothetical protein
MTKRPLTKKAIKKFGRRWSKAFKKLPRLNNGVPR